jgi:hypothetical protein
MGADESRDGGRVQVNTCSMVVQVDFFGNVSMHEGRNGQKGSILRGGRCPLEAALWEACEELYQEREYRNRIAREGGQLTLDGRVEVARTLRNPWTEQREADDARKGLVAR